MFIKQRGKYNKLTERIGQNKKYVLNGDLEILEWWGLTKSRIIDLKQIFS
jgi:hypothetical protein